MNIFRAAVPEPEPAKHIFNLTFVIYLNYTLQEDIEANTALGRPGIGTDSGDVQLVHRTPKLGITIAAGDMILKTLALSLYNASGFAMLFKIAPGDLKIGEGRFRFHKSKVPVWLS